MQCRRKLGAYISLTSLPGKCSSCYLGARTVVIPSSRFRDVPTYTFEKCPQRQAYRGVDIANLSAVARGNLLARVVRRVQCGEGADPLTADPIPGFCQNGWHRCQGRAEYDWLYQDRRVECKSSMLRFDASTQQWSFRFSSIKFSKKGVREKGLFDDLLIVLFSPRNLIVYLHDCSHGLTGAGVRTASTGHEIWLHGPRSETSWTTSLDAITAKLDASARCRIAVLPLNHEYVRAEINSLAMSKSSSLLSTAYRSVPFERLSSAARAAHFRNLVRTVDTVLHPGSHFEHPAASTRINGTRRPPYQATHSWSRNGRRVACKYAQLSFDSYHKRWRFYFAGVKLADGELRQARFDELILAMYTPRGLYIYWHDFEFGVSSNGSRTQTHGHSIEVRGPVGQECWSEALDAILEKFGSSRCVRFALVEW